MKPTLAVHRQIWRTGGSPSSGHRSIPEETAVALTYNGGTYAVMMTTPQDLEDFAVGFSLSEGVISCSADIHSLDVVRLDGGIELRMWLNKPNADRLRERQRHIAGPTGCGLCGIESIAEAMRASAIVRHGQKFSPENIMVAMQSLPSCQKLNIETHAVHAAAFWNVASGIVAVREDVGRHNALDKLSGALARGFMAAGEGDHSSYKSRVGRDGAEECRDRGARDGFRFRANRACCSHGGCGGYHARCYCAGGRIRSVHASFANFRWVRCRVGHRPANGI
jgi:FdhD protein